MAKKFNVENLSPQQAYDEYVKQDSICQNPTRIKKAIREEYLPMVLENKNSLVIGKSDEGSEFGFECRISKTFQKKEFEGLLLKEFGKKMCERIMDLYDSAKVGESRSFGTF